MTFIPALYHEETEEDKQLGEETSQYKEGPEAACLCSHLCTLFCDGVLNGDPTGQVFDVGRKPGTGCSQGHLEARMAKNHLFFFLLLLLQIEEVQPKILMPSHLKNWT